MLLQLGKALGHDLLGPVVGAGHAQRPGSGQGGKLDVARADAQAAAVFAGAAALHGGRDHHGRKADGRPRIDGAQRIKVCVPPPLAPVTPIRVGIDVRQRAQPIERADRVVGLQAHDALQAQLGLRAEKPPVLGRVHCGRARRTVRELGRNLHAVGVAQHVVMKHHAAHAGQLHAAGLQRRTAALLEPLFAAHDLLANFLRSGIVEPAVGPMAVRAEHGRQPAGLPLGPIQIAGHEMTREALRNRPSRPCSRRDRCRPCTTASAASAWAWATGRWPRAICRRTRSARCGPGLGGRTGLEGEIAVEVLQRVEAVVVPCLAGRPGTGDKQFLVRLRSAGRQYRGHQAAGAQRNQPGRLHHVVLRRVFAAHVTCCYKPPSGRCHQSSGRKICYNAAPGDGRRFEVLSWGRLLTCRRCEPGPAQVSNLPHVSGKGVAYGTRNGSLAGMPHLREAPPDRLPVLQDLGHEFSSGRPAAAHAGRAGGRHRGRYCGERGGCCQSGCGGSCQSLPQESGALPNNT